MRKNRKREHDDEAHKRRIKNLKHEPKLTICEVNDIRRSYVYQSPTHGIPALAEKYNVATNTIHKIIKGKTWKVSNGDGNVPLPEGGNKNWKAFDQQLIAEENTEIIWRRLGI